MFVVLARHICIAADCHCGRRFVISAFCDRTIGQIGAASAAAAVDETQLFVDGHEIRMMIAAAGVAGEQQERVRVDEHKLIAEVVRLLDGRAQLGVAHGLAPQLVLLLALVRLQLVFQHRRTATTTTTTTTTSNM